MPTHREWLTRQELNNRLTAELRKVKDTAGWEIRVTHLLARPDEYGCNWSDAVVVRVGPRASNGALLPFIAKIVDQARRKYNLKD